MGKRGLTFLRGGGEWGVGGGGGVYIKSKLKSEKFNDKKS